MSQTLGARAQNSVRFCLGDYSRDYVTLATAAGLVSANTVLGKITASGKYVPYDANADDGSETAVAVLEREQDATGGDIVVTAITRTAELEAAHLEWDAANDDPADITGGIADLAAVGLIVRD